MQLIRAIYLMTALLFSSVSQLDSSALAATACQEAGVTHQVKCCYHLGTQVAEEQFVEHGEALCRVQIETVERLLEQAQDLGCREEEPQSAFRAGLEAGLDHSCG